MQVINMKVVFENEFVEMSYDSQEALTEQVWFTNSNNMTVETFKEFMVFWRDFVIEQKVKYHLIDAREFLFTITPEEQEWIAIQAVGPAVEKGFEKIAQVLPEKDLFAQVSVEQTMEENAEKGGLVFAHFATVEEGRAWLLAE